jgi:predicted polyphosphate/ATP-dependent NAD kinase
VLQDNFIGSRAVWDTGHIRQIVVTRGEPHNIGISSIAGHLDPIGISEPRGLTIDFDGAEICVLAPIAPGLIRPVRLHGYRQIALDEEIAIGHIPCVIALDGEREIEVRQGETAVIRLDPDGPNVVNIRNTLRQAVASGFFRRTEILGNANWLKEDQ